MTFTRLPYYLTGLFLYLLVCTGVTRAQETAATPADLVSYDRAFFARFQPQTALDMVRQVPGFQLLENEDGPRGFAGAEGNLLINDRRPSAKADLPSAILARIPAGNVERIELIRAQVRGIDLRGQSAMVNVILHEDTAAAVKWEAATLVPFRHGPLTPIGSIALSHRWRDIRYNAGLSWTGNSYGRSGGDRLYDGADTLTEIRYDERENRIKTFKANLNTVSALADGTLIKFNTVLGNERRRQFLVSDRVPEDPDRDPRTETFDDNSDKPSLELGLDVERGLIEDLTGKAILLYYRADEDTYRTQRMLDAEGLETSFRVAEGNGLATELITRAEFDWAGMTNHTWQANIERAFNRLDGSLVSTLDTGAGPVPVTVPGANSLVKEVRWDFLLQDTWRGGDLELDLGLGAEASTITQTGDAEQERDFFFVKPQAILTWTPVAGRQTRVRVAREVAQLDLTDFISATVFEDDDLALGNPDIRPDTTWVAELNHERRFGAGSVLRVRLFHHWITDVLDLLPVTPTFEVPGNIGDGRRWGIALEGTLPLQAIGLTGAKIDFKARWQDSTVTDPVTGLSRTLSGPAGDFPISYDVENQWGLSLDFRQDFEASRVAWGWDMVTRAERPLYKVNELEIYDETVDLNLFIETTRWFGIKTRLSTINAWNAPGTRDRTVFTGERDQSQVRFRELRSRDRDQSVTITFSGVF